MSDKKIPDKKRRGGSALILAVVLTSLLVIIGTVFMLMAKVDNTASSDISTGRELTGAAESIISQLSQQLVEDVPGAKPMDPNEYYDYPGDNDRWLASTEPNIDSSGEYRWGQISDVTGFLGKIKIGSPAVGIATKGVKVEPSDRTVVKDYPEIKLNTSGNLDEGSPTDGHDNKQYRGQSADADGDGIADAKWIELENMMSSKGGKIYAAVRVIDNGGMINVNTASQLIPYGPNIKRSSIDGHSVSHVNLSKIAAGNDTIDEVLSERTKAAKPSIGVMNDYQMKYCGHYDGDYGNYAPFDLSDELELRNRFCLASKAEDRFKTQWWDTIGNKSSAFRNVPYDARTDHGLGDWKDEILNINNNFYDRRHLLTTYNMDRVIDTFGRKMTDIRRDFDAQELFDRIKPYCTDGSVAQSAQLAQIVANIKDYGDIDTDVTLVKDNDVNYWGDEAPHLRLSEIVCKNYEEYNMRYGPIMHYSYGIEVYRPYDSEKEKFDNWQLVISDYNQPIPLDSNDFTISGGRLFVVVFQDTNDPDHLGDKVKFDDSPGNEANFVDPAVILRWGDIEIQDSNGQFHPATSYDVYFGTDRKAVEDANSKDTKGVLAASGDIRSFDPHLDDVNPLDYTSDTYYWRVDGFCNIGNDSNTLNDINDIGDVWSFTTHPDINGPDPCEILKTLHFNANTKIQLQRKIDGRFITVDQVSKPDLDTSLKQDNPSHIRSYERDSHESASFKRNWRERDGDSLGRINGWDSGERIQSLRHGFNNVGEIGNVLKKSTYYDGGSTISPGDSEPAIRIDLTNRFVQNIFKYITMMDPLANKENQGDPNETRVKGRININTAPWYVIAQLPWAAVKPSSPVSGHYELAKAIVAYRDKLTDPVDYTSRPGIKGFDTIGQLRSVFAGSKEYSMNYYAMDGNDQQGYPDLTFNNRTKRDGVPDDLEESNLIFSRMSDLVTVRSDVFTAYILVRIGINGPQQRYIALLDRSGVRKLNDQVKEVSFYKVPDPR